MVRLVILVVAVLVILLGFLLLFAFRLVRSRPPRR